MITKEADDSTRRPGPPPSYEGGLKGGLKGGEVAFPSIRGALET